MPIDHGVGGESNSSDAGQFRTRSSLHRAYDFKHPNRSPRTRFARWKTSTTTSRPFGSALSSVMRTIVDVDLVSVDQITYSEFIMSLVSRPVLYVLGAAARRVCLSIQSDLTFSVSTVFSAASKIMERTRTDPIERR